MSNYPNDLPTLASMAADFIEQNYAPDLDFVPHLRRVISGETEPEWELSTEPLPMTILGHTIMIPAGTPCLTVRGAVIEDDGTIVPIKPEQDAAPMPIHPLDLALLSREFQVFATAAQEFDDATSELISKLGMLSHPETITTAQVQVLRNLLIDHQKRRQRYSDELQRISQKLANVQPAPPPEAVDLSGCLATVAGFALVGGVVLGMWIRG